MKGGAVFIVPTFCVLLLLLRMSVNKTWATELLLAHCTEPVSPLKSVIALLPWATADVGIPSVCVFFLECGTWFDGWSQGLDRALWEQFRSSNRWGRVGCASDIYPSYISAWADEDAFLLLADVWLSLFTHITVNNYLFHLSIISTWLRSHQTLSSLLQDWDHRYSLLPPQDSKQYYRLGGASVRRQKFLCR